LAEGITEETRLRLEKEKREHEETFAEALPEAEALLTQEKKDKADAAKRAAEVNRIRNTCRAVYASTIDQKISDLTVRQTEQAQACRLMNLYPPR
jgi:hypothetical protein